jgi:hypothetical protein
LIGGLAPAATFRDPFGAEKAQTTRSYKRPCAGQQAASSPTGDAIAGFLKNRG